MRGGIRIPSSRCSLRALAGFGLVGHIEAHVEYDLLQKREVLGRVLLVDGAAVFTQATSAIQFNYKQKHDCSSSTELSDLLSELAICNRSLPLCRSRDSRERWEL